MNAPLATRRGLIRRTLRYAPHRWTLLQAVRRLELDGYSGHIDFQANGAGHEVEAVAMPRRGAAVVTATPAALGGLGRALEAAQRQDADGSATQADRAYRLLRDIWERGRPEVVWERDSRQGAANAFEDELLALGGIDSSEIDALPRGAVASIVGLLLRGTALDVTAACAEVLAVPVSIGRARHINGVRLWVGPLTWPQYLAFAPDAGPTPLRALLQLAALFFGPAVFEVVLVLHRDETPRCKAGAASACPGRTAWLFSGPRPRRHVLTRLDADCCRRLLQPEVSS